MTTTEERPASRVRPELRLFRGPLSFAQAIEQVIARDLAGDDVWQLTIAGRMEAAATLHELTGGKGRGR